MLKKKFNETRKISKKTGNLNKKPITAIECHEPARTIELAVYPVYNALAGYSPANPVHQSLVNRQ